MDSLKNVEKSFHKLIKKFLIEEYIGDYDYHLPILNEELLTKKEYHRIPGMFGGVLYFLEIENEKPILYAHVSSRMDFDELYIVDEFSYQLIESGEYLKKFCENNKKHQSDRF